MGALVSGVLFFWMITEGTMDPLHLQEAEAGGFYDAQARSWFEGRWDLPPEELGFEAFVIDDRHYVYFGPVPSLLRVPVLAVTDSFDHRLSAVSMTAAFALMMVFATALGWRIRTLIRGPDAPVSRGEAVIAFGWTVMLGGGSTVLWLASQAWAYHEAMLWALAFALGSFTYLLDHLHRPSVKTLALTTTFATAAILSRATIGAGAVLALGVVAGASLAAAAARLDPIRHMGDRLGQVLQAPARWLRCGEVPALGAALALMVPVVLYASVNLIKFGSMFRLPVDRQIYLTELSEVRRQVLAENGNSLFGLKYLPTNLFHYLRPDGFDLDRLYPFITYPGQAPTVFGDIAYDGLQPATSLLVSMPVFMILAAIGLVVVARGRGGPRAPGPAPLRAVILGALVTTVPVLSIAWINQRYLIDIVPVLVVAGLAGLHYLLGRASRADPSDRRRRAGIAAATAFTLAVVASVHVNAGLTVVYQRVVFPDGDRTGLVAFQQDLDERLFGTRPPVVRTGDELPDGSPLGELLMVGDCAGLYQSIDAYGTGDDRSAWVPVERSNGTGVFDLVVDFPDERPNATEPLLVSGPPGEREVIAVEYLPDQTARLAFGVEADNLLFSGEPFAVDTDEGQDLELVFDRVNREISASVDDELVLSSIYWGAENNGDILVGEGGFAPLTAPRFTGRLTNQPRETPICDDIQQRLE